jgi:glutathione synthase/RimK-type ligase-like ATP-grasp enzyme
VGRRDYTSRSAEFLAWAAAVDSLTRLVNPLEVLVRNAHKRYLLDLERAGVPIVPTTLLRPGASTAEQRAAFAAHGGEVVIKPAVSAGARGTVRARSGSSEAAEALAVALDLGDVLVQPFLPAVTDGEVSLLYIGGRFTHAVRKIPAAGDFRVQEHIGGVVQRHQPDAEEMAVADRALVTIDSTLSYARVDLVRRNGRPVVMEVELVEPELFLGMADGVADALADHLVSLI